MIPGQIENFRREQVARDAARRAPGGDAPAAENQVLRRGIAKIHSNDGDGKYVITEQWWDSDSGNWVNATAPVGLVEANARDIAGCIDGAVADVARFWQERDKDDNTVTFIDIHPLEVPAGGTQYQVLQKDSNVDYDYSWDWTRGHA